jgi:hypothetical protein
VYSTAEQSNVMTVVWERSVDDDDVEEDGKFDGIYRADE